MLVCIHTLKATSRCFVATQTALPRSPTLSILLFPGALGWPFLGSIPEFSIYGYEYVLGLSAKLGNVLIVSCFAAMGAVRVS